MHNPRFATLEAGSTVSLIGYKIIASILIFLVSIATVIFPLKSKSIFKHHEAVGLGEALASGIFLGAAFFHMLPDAINSLATLYPNSTFPLAETVCVAGFLFFLLLERISLAFPDVHTANSIPYMLAITLTIHALIEGMALGIGGSLTEALMFFIAILAHKGSESFALCIIMLKNNVPFRRILYIIGFFSLMTPIGIYLGTLLNVMTTLGTHTTLIAALFDAFAAGSFFYISTLHHVHFHEHTRDTRGLVEFISLVFGVTLMGVIALGR